MVRVYLLSSWNMRIFIWLVGGHCRGVDARRRRNWTRRTGAGLREERECTINTIGWNMRHMKMTWVLYTGCLQLLWLQIWDLFETFFRQIWDHSRGFYVIDLMRIELLRQIIFQSPSLFKLVSLYSWATKTQERTIRTFHSYQWDINYFIFQMDGIQIAFFGTRSGGYRWIGWLNALKNTYR